MTRQDIERSLPCGYRIQGVPLKLRLVHYRACQHSYCQHRLSEFNKIKAEFTKDQERK